MSADLKMLLTPELPIAISWFFVLMTTLGAKATDISMERYLVYTTST
jgi:hypothetical protein